MLSLTNLFCNRETEVLRAMLRDAEKANRVHEFLLTPLAYPDRPKNVELKETHISWVYLTDRYVYKQKKPVDFEFLDFTTLELREHYCKREVELNRRFSPDVYVGAVPVCDNGNGGFQLKAGPHPVEWLVKMKRLDESETLESLTIGSGVSQQRIGNLLKKLTEFYTAQAPAMLRSADFMKRLRNHIVGNRNDLMICRAENVSATRYTANAQLRCVSLEHESFVRRVADGRVVDGHGDLRPEHVYFHRNKPQIIDCVEFSSEYRTNDVMDELSFLAMECDRLGRHDIGESLISSYVRESSDHPPSFLPCFYKCYRACVRAKVAAIRATQTVGVLALESDGLAHEYQELARSYADEIGPRFVLIVGGLSGTGKSTLANALQDALAAELLQTDVIRQEVFVSKRSNGKYTLAGRRRVYDAMVERMRAGLTESPTLIVDGTFGSAEKRRIVVEEAEALDALPIQIECVCPSKVAAARIQRRLEKQNEPSEATVEVLKNQQQERRQMLTDVPAISVDTTQKLDDQLQAVCEFLRGFPFER